MPKWIHERAKHLLAKNPSMDKSQAFAIATQQAHKTGKTPKDYGTPEGKKKAKQKYDKPKKEYKKTPNPGDLETPKLGEVLVDFFKVAAASGNDPYLLDQIGQHKNKPKKALPPNPSFQVKQADDPSLLKNVSVGSAIGSSLVGAPMAALAGPKAGAVGGGLGALIGAKAGYDRYRHKKEKAKARDRQMAPWIAAAKRAKETGEKQTIEFSPEVAPPGMKVAFTTSQYSGPLGPGGRVQYAGIVPPFRRPQFKQAGPDEEALAKVQKEQHEKDVFTPLAKVGETSNSSQRKKMLAGGAGALLGGRALQRASGVGVMDRLHRTLDNDDLKMFEHLKSTAEIPVVSPEEVHAHLPKFIEKNVDPEVAKGIRQGMRQNVSRAAQAGVWMPTGSAKRTPVVGIGTKNPEVLAHELGHNRINDSRLGRLLQNSGTSIAGALGRSVALGGITGALTGRSENENVQRAGRWAPAALSAGFLGFEGAATGLGLLRMRRAGANRKQILNAVKTMAPAYGTYLGGAIAGTGAAHLGQGLTKKDLTQRDAEKLSSMRDELAKLNAIQSPEAQITKTQKVGLPKATNPPGPSIQQVSKPVGFGKPLAGATKPNQV